MVLPPGYSLWLFFYKPFMWCRPDARLRHYYSCSFPSRGVIQTLVWHRHYYSCSFLSRSHSDPRLAPALLLRVTPKFLFGFFSKDFIWLEGSDLNFFFKRTLPLIYFSLWQKFCLDSPKICLWPWELLLFIWAQDKMFFIWENNLWKSFWECTMAFGKSFATFNYSFLPWH